MAVVQQKPSDDTREIKSTVRYSVSAIQILNALQYLTQHHIEYRNKKVLPMEKIEEMLHSSELSIHTLIIIAQQLHRSLRMQMMILLGQGIEISSG